MVNTNTARVRNARRELVELILSDHDGDCLTCIKNSRCELQDVARTVGIKEIAGKGKKNKRPIDDFERLHREGPEQVHPLRPVHQRLLGDTDRERPHPRQQGLRY